MPQELFPLPVMKIMIDSTIGHEALCFMDCTTGYNQIQMVPEDREATAFCMPKSIFCYKVMPSDLKNGGATFQTMMETIFEDMLHKIVHCDVNDLIVKLKRSHITCMIFGRSWKDYEGANSK